MCLVGRLHSFEIRHVYIFFPPIEALAKVNLKRDSASREKISHVEQMEKE